MSEQINYVGETGGDVYLDVTFYKAIYNGEEADFIKIGVPGDKTITIDTLADDVHKARFKRQYDAYIGYRDIKGHPIDEWEEIPRFKKFCAFVLICTPPIILANAESGAPAICSTHLKP